MLATSEKADVRIVLGLQPVREAVRVHGGALERVLAAKTGGPRVAALARFARDQGVTVDEVDKARIDKLSRGAHHQGVLAFAPPLPLHDLEAMEVTARTLLVILDGITDPQNFGAVIRGVVALGGTGIVWGEHGAAPLSPATFRASAGAVEHATLYQAASLRGAITSLSSRGVLTVSLDADAPATISELELGQPVALVVGAEDKGVSRGVRRVCTASARLPMAGPIHSLNASVASALAVYEVTRQRAGLPAISQA